MSAEKVFLKGNMAKAAKMYNDNEAEISGGGITDMVSRFLEKTVNPYLSKQLKQQYADKAKAKEAPKASPSKVVPVRSKLHPSAKRVPSGNVGIATQQSPDEGPSISSGVRDEPKPTSRPKGPPPSFAKVADSQIKILENAKPPDALATTFSELEADIDAVKDLESMPTLTIKETDQPEPMGETAVARKPRKGKTAAVVPSGNMLATKALPTFICRVGTKADIAKWIVKHMTKEALQTYVEPFIGGGAIYLEKAPAQKEAINDFNYGIYKSWLDLKNTRPSAMLEEWRKDKATRAYAKTVLGHGKQYGIETLNIKAYIERNLKAKGANAEKKAFGKPEASEWTSLLDGNKLRYMPKKESQPSEDKKADPNTLVYIDLKDGSEKKYPLAKAKMLYALVRAGRNLLDNTRSNKLDIAEFTGAAKPTKEATKDIVEELMEEDLPKMGLREWLKDRFTVQKNPDKYAIKAEEDILVGKTKVAELIYEKLRSCGGFGGSGVVSSDAFIAYMNGSSQSPIVKVPMGEALKFLLYPDGGLAKYNERLKDTEVENGDYYKLVEKYDSPNTFLMLDPPYQATGGYGNPTAFNFEAFVKALNGVPDKILKAKNPKLKSKILVTINGGDKVLALFRKYARVSGIPWYGLKVYVRQKAGKGGYRYEIFYGNYKFDERAVNVLDETFRNNFSGVNVKEEDASQFKEPTDEGAIYIDSDGSDKTWATFKEATNAVGHFAARNAEDKNVGKEEVKYREDGTEAPAAPVAKKSRSKKTAEAAVPVNEIVEVPEAAPAPAKKPRKPRAKKGGNCGCESDYEYMTGGSFLNDDLDVAEGMIGGYYSPNRPPHLGSKYAFTPSVGYGGSEYTTFDY